MADQHPYVHCEHHQIFGQRNEARRDVAVTAYVRAFEMRLLI